MQLHCRGQEVLPSTCPRQRRRPQQVPQVFATGNIMTKFVVMKQRKLWSRHPNSVNESVL